VEGGEVVEKIPCQISVKQTAASSPCQTHFRPAKQPAKGLTVRCHS